MAKKKPENAQTPVYDFSINKVFRGWLLSETPEQLIFETEFETKDGEPEIVAVAKTPGLDKAMKAQVNGTPVNELDALIEITYLGEGQAGKKFKVDVELDEPEK